MYKFSFISILFLVLLGCKRPDDDVTQQLNEARALYEQAKYGSAKQILDDVRVHRSKNADSRQKALLLMREIEIKEQERNLLFCEQLIEVSQAELDSLKRQFVFEKTEYDYEGHYIPKSWNPSENSGSHFIKINVNGSGNIALICVHKGKDIGYNRLKVSASGEFAETQAIPFDGGANYTYQDLDGVTYQIVTFQQARDNGVLPFIYNHATANVSVAYEGGKKAAPFLLTAKEKDAVVQTVNLATLLSEVDKLRAQQEKAKKRLEYLRSKM